MERVFSFNFFSDYDGNKITYVDRSCAPKCVSGARCEAALVDFGARVVADARRFDLPAELEVVDEVADQRELQYPRPLTLVGVRARRRIDVPAVPVSRLDTRTREI